jgi:hypothetical protein
MNRIELALKSSRGLQQQPVETRKVKQENAMRTCDGLIHLNCIRGSNILYVPSISLGEFINVVS